MLGLIKQIGQMLVDKGKSLLDDPEQCDALSEHDLELVIMMLNEPDKFSNDAAIEYMKKAGLKINRNYFYDLRNGGIIPDPIKSPKFKEKFYTKGMLDEAIAKIKSMSDKEIRRALIRGRV